MSIGVGIFYQHPHVISETRLFDIMNQLQIYEYFVLEKALFNRISDILSHPNTHMSNTELKIVFLCHIHHTSLLICTCELFVVTFKIF